jgi:hypothetical protein
LPVLLSFAIAASGTLASPASAEDEVAGTRSEKLIEKSHQIELRMDRGHAELVVRRTVWNGGPRHDQAVFHIELPQGAVATGLRTLGMKDGKPIWFKGDLMEAEAAAKKYRELTGVGGFYPKDPALLSWRTQSLLALQVFPVAPSEPKTIEYTLKIPTSYSDGRHRLKLPKMGTKALAAEAFVRPAHAEDTLFIDERPAEVGVRIKLNIEDGIEIGLARGNAPKLDGALAMVPFAPKRALVNFHVEAAARLAEVPRRASVVVLLDASRSLTPEQAQSAKAAAGAYLSHFKDANVEIMLFNRRPQELFGAFVPAARAALELEKLAIQPGNGSAIEEALARADARLANARGSAKRILVLTDLRTRSMLSPELAAGRLGKSGALVHIGVVGSLKSPSLMRDDEHPWDKVARPTGGLVWMAGASASPDDRAAMKEVFEELARPIRIDHLKVAAPGLTEDDLSIFPPTLDEGQGIESSRINAKQVAWVDVKGELWSTPIRKVIVPDEAEGRLRSALVFGSHLLGDLTEEEMMPLALRGQAVSPVTSYLAIEPGVRPSTEGLEIGEGFGAGGFGLSGVGEGGGGLGHGSFMRTNELSRILREQLMASWKACGGGDRSISVDIETTLREIVDIRLQRSVPPAPDAERCLEDAAWAIDLPSVFTAQWLSFSFAI